MSETPLPADKLPPCWSDDVRMNALFAPFRCKSLNPESWDGKMKFWSEIIQHWCLYKRDAFVSVAKVKSTFRRNGRTPACLELVVEDMVNSGALVPNDKYSSLTTPDATGWLRWGTSKALSSGGIALRFITSFLPMPFKTRESEDGFPMASINSETVYLMEAALKDISQELLLAFSKMETRIGTLKELRTATGFASSSSEIDCDMFTAVLGYMLANKMATRKGDLYKIADPGAAVQPISEQDTTLHQLRTAETSLEEKATRLYEKAEQERMAAVTSLRAGNKSAARNSLRRKNWLTQQHEDTEKLLDNVRQLAYRILQTDSDAKVLDTYKHTMNSMKKTQVEKGLEVDNVHDLMEDLNEVLIGFSKESNVSLHRWNCGGSLITDSWVLTAGHCLTDTSAGPPQRLRVGTTSFEHEEVDDLTQERSVGVIIPHPEYKPPAKYNDIALIKTDRPFELNRHVRIACLPWDKNFTVHNATATGFGKTAYESRAGSLTLMKVDIDIIERTICNRSFQSMIRRSKALQYGIQESQLCAGDMKGGKDTCQGDSGGPLQILPKDINCVTSFPLYQVVGVTSFGRFCGFSNSPGVYTRVTHYVPWIESVVWPG